LRWAQLAALVKRRMLPRNELRGWKPVPVNLRKVSPPPTFPEWQRDSALHTLEAGEFCFQNVTHASCECIPWSSKGFSRLWLYHLNYFDFVNLDLSAPRHRFHLRKALELAGDWCRQNQTGGEIGWEPYPLSLRIVNWLKFLIRNAERAEALGEAEILSLILASLRIQALALETRLEMDLLANHLLKNIKALMFAGALLEAPESARWWGKGEKLLGRELEEQVLPDGGHIERSPMYHEEVLEDLLDLQVLAEACGRTADSAELLSRGVTRMADFLGCMLHPDGEIPLFNDAAFGIARPAGELLARAKQPAKASSSACPKVRVFPQSGYAVLRAPRSESCLIFDCGPLGPDYQPGHAHCDVLSYELSLHGWRVVVDTGVSTYERCPERLYERSTAAHNTLRIDGEEQAEVWASFRLGRRPKVGRVEGGEINNLYFVQGAHYAYQRRGVVHSRLIALMPGNSWLVIDSLNGTGKHLVESFVHFHPAVRVEIQNDSAPDGAGTGATGWAIRFGEYQYFLTTHGSGELAARESWYAPEFGLRQPQTALHWTWRGDLPVRLVYAFTPAGQTPRVIPLDLIREGVEKVHTALGSS
jgi:uncharacterized heparinase superfamily protein